MEANSRAEWLELYEERAAIIEYHGGLPRHVAEQRAAEQLGGPPAAAGPPSSPQQPPGQQVES